MSLGLLLANANNLSKYKIVCGEHELNRKDDTQVEMSVTAIIPHKDYASADRTGHDIAIFRVRINECNKLD